MGAADLQEKARPRATTGDPKGPFVEHVAIILSEVVTSTATWALDISVQFAEGDARGSLGRIITSPLRYSTQQRMGANKRAARVVALASCAGAVQWFVDGQIASVFGDEDGVNKPKNNRASLWIEASPHGAGAPLVAIEGSIVPRNRFWYDSGTIFPAPLTLPPALTLQQLNVLAAPSPGGGCQIVLTAGGSTITVPAGVAMNLTPNRVFNSFGPHFITMVGDVSSWYAQGEY